MVGDFVFTQHDLVDSNVPGGCRNDSLVYGCWGIDIHQETRTAVRNTADDDGVLYAFNEGLTRPSTGGSPKFDIPYGRLGRWLQGCVPVL